MDILVKAPPTGGPYVFVLTDTTALAPFDILTVKVTGNAVSMEFPTKDNYPAFPPFLAKDIEASELNQKPRTLDFGWEAGRSSPGPDPKTNKAAEFMIDGRKFSGKDYDQTVLLDAVEEWTLNNSTSAIAHPFHIHVNPFQVVEICDPTISPEPYKPEKNFLWQDVIAIPPSLLDGDGKVTNQGYVKIRHRFVDFVGSYVLHCHMLAHEDRGMMQLVRVVSKEDADKKPPAVPHH